MRTFLLQIVIAEYFYIFVVYIRIVAGGHNIEYMKFMCCWGRHQGGRGVGKTKMNIPFNMCISVVSLDNMYVIRFNTQQNGTTVIIVVCAVPS